jgi:ribosome biogenesis protein NSA1
MRIICGGETGLIKIVEPESNKILQNWGVQKKESHINCMCWSKPGSEAEFTVARKDKSIETFFPSTGDKRFTYTSNFVPKSIHRFFFGKFNSKNSFETNEKRTVLIVAEDGNVEISTLSLKSSKNELKQSTFKVTGPIQAMTTFHHKNDSKIEFAVGGKENLLKIYDLETKKETFKAKNVKHDFLDMKVPLAISDICFMDENMISYCTLYHQIRLHDRRVGPKVIMQKAYGEYAFTKMIPSPLNPLSEVIVGSTNGGIISMNWNDVKKKKFAAFKGSPGSIRDLCVHPKLNYFSTTGADRFVRVFDISRKKLLFSTYLIQKQTCVLFTSEKEVKENSEEEESESEEEEQIRTINKKEELWNSMEIVADGEDDEEGEEYDDDEEEDQEGEDEEDEEEEESEEEEVKPQPKKRKFK